MVPTEVVCGVPWLADAAAGWLTVKPYAGLILPPPLSVTATLKLYDVALAGVKLKVTVPGAFVKGGDDVPSGLGVEYGGVPPEAVNT